MVRLGPFGLWSQVQSGGFRIDDYRLKSGLFNAVHARGVDGTYCGPLRGGARRPETVDRQQRVLLHRARSKVRAAIEADLGGPAL
jgi:hypothetical protein